MVLSLGDWSRALALSGASQDTLDQFRRYPQDWRPTPQLPEGTDRALNLASGMSEQELARALAGRNGAPIGATKNDPGYAAKMASGALGPVDISSQDDPQLAATLAATKAPRQLPPDAAQALAAYQARFATLGSQAADKGVRRNLAGNDAPTGVLGTTGGAPVFDINGPETQRALDIAAGRTPPAGPIDQPRVPLRRDLLENQAEHLGLLERQGQIRSEGARREAVTHGEVEQQGREGLSRAQSAVAENRTQQQEFERQAYERLSKISRMVDNPPDTTKGSVLRAIGAIVSGMPGIGGIGAGLSMMGRDMAGDVATWRQQIEAQRGALMSQLGAAEHEQSDTEHQLRTARGLLDMGFGVRDAAIARIKAETDSQDVVAAADLLQNEWRGKYVQAQYEINKALADRGARDALYQMPMEQLAQRIAAGDVGESGQEIYGKRAKASQDIRSGEIGIQKGQQSLLSGEAEIELKRVQTDKERAEVGAGPKLSDGDRKLQRLAEGVKPAYQSLNKLADRVAKDKGNVPYIGIGPGASQMLASEETQNLNSDIMQIANVLLRDESGASLPESEQDTKWSSWGITSPDQAVRNRGLGKMLAEYEGRVARVQPAGSAPAAPSGRQQGSEDTVMMRSPLGRMVPVPKDKAEVARAKGYTIQGLDLANVVGRSR